MPADDEEKLVVIAELREPYPKPDDMATLWYLTRRVVRVSGKVNHEDMTPVRGGREGDPHLSA